MLPTLYKSSWLTLYSYPILLGLAWAVGFQYYEKIFSKIVENKNQRFFLFWGAFFVSWIGAKAFFLIFSAKEFMEQMYSQTSFWIGGGFVFYGGLISGFCFLFLSTRLLKMNQVQFFSKLAPVMALSHSIGRLGCVLAGCCFGKELNFFGFYKLPTQLIEAIFLFALWRLLKEGKETNLYLYPLGYGVFRFFIEFFRGDLIRGELIEGISTSQGLSLIIILITLTWIVLRKKIKV